MKIVLDSCVWGGAKLEIAAAGHDVVWIGDWPKDPGDDEILEFARRETRVVITLDKDFGELAVHQRQPHCGIVRLVRIAAKEHGRCANEVIRLHEAELAAGAIVTAEPGRLRIRLPPE